MANTIIGKVLTIGQAVNVSKQKEYLKRELVLDCTRYDPMTGEPIENYVSMFFTQRRCEELNGYKAGDMVEVAFFLNGRKYEKDGQTKYITDIIGLKVERWGQQSAAPEPTGEAPAPAQFPYQQQIEQTENKELPF